VRNKKIDWDINITFSFSCIGEKMRKFEIKAGVLWEGERFGLIQRPTWLICEILFCPF